MSKRIALFFDGTWNNPGDNTNITRIKKHVIGAASMEGAPLVDDSEGGENNVYRLFLRMIAQRSFRMFGGELVSDGPTEGTEGERHSEREQIKYYHRGVGERLGEWVRGGVGGYGLSRSIQEAYLWLAKHYEDNDEIFLFGFSRGAFTARSFAGLIDACGIPSDQDEWTLVVQIKDAYEVYRQLPPDPLLKDQYRKTYGKYIHPNPRIKFIGVWDTVGALGLGDRLRWIGRQNFAWHDIELKPIVENACHAMALDEHRPDFDVDEWKQCNPNQKVEQRWFIGAHSNVGGGYKKDRLSDISLKWMQDKAKSCNLEFISDVKVDHDAYLDPIADSYKKAFLRAYPLLSKVRGKNRLYRRLLRGIKIRMDPTILQRVRNPLGDDERGRKYNYLRNP